MTTGKQTEREAGASNSRDGPAGDEPPAAREDEDAISTDMTFEILKNWRRRQVLRYLRSNGGGEARLDDLAEHIAALENDVDEAALSSSQRKRVYIALYQCHLPKMADVGAIEYEKARGQIRLQPEAAKLYRYLDLERNDDEVPLLAALRTAFASF